ncbi:MAG: hypothetical protein IEMM0003_0883 [bacterium]|nr:MAG: hypothetical protein IEMM0003_0883 [bacterium]
MFVMIGFSGALLQYTAQGLIELSLKAVVSGVALKDIAKQK